jgi:serine/threonine protein kinase
VIDESECRGSSPSGEPHLGEFEYGGIFLDPSAPRLVSAQDIAYDAPELISQDSDESPAAAIYVYSFGVFLYAIFTESFTLLGPRVRTTFNHQWRINKGERFIRPEKMPDPFWTLISECWDQQPDQRPSFAEITRRMMDCDEFTIEGTDMGEYGEYRTRIMREPLNDVQIDPSRTAPQLGSLGLQVESLKIIGRQVPID